MSRFETDMVRGLSTGLILKNDLALGRESGVALSRRLDWSGTWQLTWRVVWHVADGM